MPDQFENAAQSVLGPSENAYAVTPNDTSPLPLVPKFLYIGNAGRVTLRSMDAASDVVFENVPAGSYLYVRATHIRSSGTTASSIVACA